MLPLIRPTRILKTSTRHKISENLEVLHGSASNFLRSTLVINEQHLPIKPCTYSEIWRSSDLGKSVHLLGIPPYKCRRKNLLSLHSLRGNYSQETLHCSHIHPRLKKKTAYDKPTKVKQRLFKSDLPSVVLISGWTVVIEDNFYFSSTMTRVIFSRIFSMNNGVYYLPFKNWAQLIKGLLALNLG